MEMKMKDYLKLVGGGDDESEEGIMMRGRGEKT